MPANSIHVAIVGSGPSGFYAAEALLKSPHDIQVDMYERLPTPYGLVRSGVAPDHPKLKEVTLVYERIMRSERFGFFGNVEIGIDVCLTDLLDAYHAVVLAYGASRDRKLGIEGEDLPGCHSATDFVGWYNGHPDFRARSFDLSQEVATVVGNGNVAADVCRILLQPVDALRRTDIAAHALEALAESRVREVHLIGRRGPAQAKFTPKELRELGAIPGCGVVIHPTAWEVNGASEVEMADRLNINAAKNVDLFRSFAERVNTYPRRLEFHFCASPTKVQGRSRVEGILLRQNRLEGDPFKQVAVPTDRIRSLACGLVFSSIGYRAAPIEGAPFDEARGVVPNERGKAIADATSLAPPGLYVTGWLKRGPTGIIGTNRADSIETVQSLEKDLSVLSPRAVAGRHAVEPRLAQRNVRPVPVGGWLQIDEIERSRGAAAGRAREKITHIDEMLAIASARTNLHPTPNQGSGATGPLR